MSTDSFDGTALIRAAERGHADIVGALLVAGVPVDHVNNLGWTALHEALEFAPLAGGDNRGSAEEYIDTVRVLLAAGADPRLPAADNRTPSDIARQHGLAEQESLLAGVSTARENAIDQKTADAALLAAAQSGDAVAAVAALAQGASAEARDPRERTPLLLASAADRVQVARLLVRLGADPDAIDDQSDTPWLVTGVTGSVAMVEVLLPANPDLTLTNRYGGLSPIPASERGHADYVERMVGTDVDLDHINNIGWTALLEAVILGDGSEPYQRIVQTLVDAGVDTGIRDRGGLTARDHAVAKGQHRVADILAG